MLSIQFNFGHWFEMFPSHLPMDPLHPSSSKVLDDMSNKPAPAQHEKRVKRPTNSFMVFSNQKRKELLKKNPAMTNLMISKILDEEWNKLTEEAKLPYINQANIVNLQYQKDNPKYLQYRPKRKPKRKSQWAEHVLPPGHHAGFPLSLTYATPIINPWAMPHTLGYPGLYHQVSLQHKMENWNTSFAPAVSAYGNNYASLDVNSSYRSMSSTVGNPITLAQHHPNDLNSHFPASHHTWRTNLYSNFYDFPSTSESTASSTVTTYDANDINDANRNLLHHQGSTNSFTSTQRRLDDEV